MNLSQKIRHHVFFWDTVYINKTQKCVHIICSETFPGSSRLWQFCNHLKELRVQQSNPQWTTGLATFAAIVRVGLNVDNAKIQSENLPEVMKWLLCLCVFWSSSVNESANQLRSMMRLVLLSLVLFISLIYRSNCLPTQYAFLQLSRLTGTVACNTHYTSQTYQKIKKLELYTKLHQNRRLRG